MRTQPTTPETPSPNALHRQEPVTPSRQLIKTTPLGAYPTPQSSINVTSPPSAPALASTEMSGHTGQIHGTNDIGVYLTAHDDLRKLYPNEEKVPHTRICVLGAQSAGKSSFLSALTGIDLYCAERRATCCRTLMSSRRGGDTFQATIYIIVVDARSGEAQSTLFASFHAEIKEMGEICHWAGEEARRADGANQTVRSWKGLLSMSIDERNTGKNNWPDFTRNVVIINVTGPGRPNLDIEDLPGLNGHVVPQRLVSDCISQPQNIIVLCLSAGSKDASSADPEVKLAKTHDPTGKRTIGIITRADHMVPSLDEGTTFVDYLLEIGNHLGGFTPQGGWWPLRLRSHRERCDGLSLQQVRQLEMELFKDDEWMKIQERKGRHFGIGELEKKLEEMFSQKVRQNMIFLRKNIRETMKTHSEWLSSNPTIQNPVAALHDQVIHKFTERLKEKVQRANQSGKLFDLQSQFERNIQEAVPEFLPFTEAEGNQEGYQSFWEGQGIRVGGEDLIYVDALLEKINQYTSRRNPDEIDARAIMQFFQKTYLARWADTTRAHASSLWIELEQMLLDAAKEICGDNVALLEDMLRHLEDLTQDNKQSTSDFVDDMVILFSSPPSDLVSATKPRLTNLKEDSVNHFLTFLNRPLRNISSAASGSTSPSSVVSSGPRLVHETFTLHERTRCAQLQASIEIAMMTWAIEFSCVVGKHSQLKILTYVKNVTPALRNGMGLNEVVESVRKRAGDRFESDRTKKREREIRLGEVKKLEDIQQHFESITDI
ncbi:uncharacterized protein IL334_004693 [Kwoniella shivajii]|uniref:Dynamin GTPase domain-containing protein n=1 Tax=Kwoniella shivajii TaxID=564305 RepID=A0ABZ1D116_9TREE|nr:hypothetical protein IL334_004693 [Kwoniella shivajii]